MFARARVGVSAPACACDRIIYLWLCWLAPGSLESLYCGYTASYMAARARPFLTKCDIPPVGASVPMDCPAVKRMPCTLCADFF